MAKKTTDKRPSRSKQKGRSVENKKKQLARHLKLYPNDENAYDVLAHIKKTGNSRGRSGINAAIEARKLEEQRKNHKNLKAKKR